MSVNVLRNGLVSMDGQLPQILQDEFCHHNDWIQKAQKIEQFSDFEKSFWYNMSFYIKLAEKLEHILALISLYIQNTWIRKIISDIGMIIYFQ